MRNPIPKKNGVEVERLGDSFLNLHVSFIRANNLHVLRVWIDCLSQIKTCLTIQSSLKEKVSSLLPTRRSAQFLEPRAEKKRINKQNPRTHEATLCVSDSAGAGYSCKDCLRFSL